MKSICIIDSGYSREHPKIISGNIIKELGFKKDEKNKIIVIHDTLDQIGHGTAVLSIIQSHCPDAKCIVIKIFFEELSCDEDVLLYTMEYIEHNITCDILNLSLGITTCREKNKLLRICKRISEKGTLIVSAFDNNGSVSYPAMFDCVLGIDSDVYCKNAKDFITVDNCKVNLFGFGNTQRVAWTDPPYLFVKGSSFANAHISGILLKAGITNISEAKKYLKKHSVKHLYCEVRSPEKPLQFKIKKAVAFPYNKEIHSLINYSNLLTFQLEGVYDTPKLGKVGRKVNTLKSDRTFIIENISKLNWNGDFDTLILGHMDELNRILGYDLRYKLIEACVVNKKKIYAFDDLSYDILMNYRKDYFCPQSKPCPFKFGKMYDIFVPVLGVFGTSSWQGKYTLQLALRQLFLNNDYKIGQIGTEPSAFLFGMDEMFHFGYANKFSLNEFDFVERINYSMNQLQYKGVDIILSGCQSNTIPYAMKNSRYFSFKQIEFLLGLNPDCIVLCVNTFDDLEYIKRTKYYLESIVECKVIAIVTYPMNITNFWMLGHRDKVTDQDIMKFKTIIFNKLNIPCYTLGIPEEMNALFNDIVTFFA